LNAEVHEFKRADQILLAARSFLARRIDSRLPEIWLRRAAMTRRTESSSSTAKSRRIQVVEEFLIRRERQAWIKPAG